MTLNSSDLDPVEEDVPLRLRQVLVLFPQLQVNECMTFRGVRPVDFPFARKMESYLMFWSDASMGDDHRWL